jgi:glyceraldehyde-3-phosphate dehydrogenase (NADP+)
VAGGQPAEGNYFTPTVLVDVTPDMPVMKDEVFAPVAPVCRFGSLDEAVAMANDSDYGLQSSVFSSNISNALKVAHRLEVGGVVINGPGAFRPGNVPFGGAKQSGIGRESIVDTVLEMTEEKTIVITNAL